MKYVMAVLILVCVALGSVALQSPAGGGLTILSNTQCATPGAGVFSICKPTGGGPAQWTDEGSAYAPVNFAPAQQQITFTIGTVTTLPAGSQATASITGTSPNFILNLGIPQGATGATGAIGATGPQGPPPPSGTKLNVTATIQ